MNLQDRVFNDVSMDNNCNAYSVPVKDLEFTDQLSDY